MAEIKAELIYFLMPIAGLSRMIAGTWWKAMDRFIAPAIIAVTLYLFMGFSWWLIPTLIGFIAVKTLPVTLVGSSVKKPIINRFWVFVLGYIQSLPAVFMFLSDWSLYLTLCLIPMIVYGVSINLSNVNVTARFFRWKFVEFVNGAICVYPLCYLLGN